MRSEDEIKCMLDQLREHEIPSMPEISLPGQELICADWEGNTFKYGYLVGKLTALAWAMGEPSADMVNNYDFEDWIKEVRAMRDGNAGSISPENRRDSDQCGEK